MGMETIIARTWGQTQGGARWPPASEPAPELGCYPWPFGANLGRVEPKANKHPPPPGGGKIPAGPVELGPVGLSCPVDPT